MQPTGYHAQSRWTSSLSNRLLIEAGFSVQYNKWRREQHDWNTRTARRRTTCRTGTWGGGFWITGWQPEQSQYIKTSLSYVTGSHNFKGGVEHRWGTIGLDQPMNADVRAYYFDDGVPAGLQVLSTPLGNYEGRINFDTGIFAQDSWTLGNWTLNLGTRADFFSSEVPPQQAGAGTWVPERSFPRYAGPRWNTFVARVGVAYDVFGDGRTAIKGTAHQYVSQESTRLALERNPMSSYTWSAASEYRVVERPRREPVDRRPGRAGPVRGGGQVAQRELRDSERRHRPGPRRPRGELGVQRVDSARGVLGGLRVLRLVPPQLPQHVAPRQPAAGS